MPLMQLTQPAPPGGDAAPIAATESASADVGAVIIGYAWVLCGIGLGIGLLYWRNPHGFTPAAGISVFAPLYILAQAIERFIDPFTTMIRAKAPTSNAKVKGQAARSALNTALQQQDVAAAATWQQVVDTVRRNTAVIAWGFASFIGITLCGLFGLFMLRLVGFAGVPKAVDVVLSGLAVGSGTKPLHDLISNLQTSKEAKQDPPEKKAI